MYNRAVSYTHLDVYKRQLEMHETHKGKVGIVSKVEVATRDDLSTAYTPGVAEPCRRILSLIHIYRLHTEDQARILRAQLRQHCR